MRSADYEVAQPASFFTEDANDVVTMHFTTTVRTELGKFRQIWSTMSLKSDFFETLKTHRRLPIASPEEGFKLLEREAELTKKNENLAKEKNPSSSRVVSSSTLAHHLSVNYFGQCVHLGSHFPPRSAVALSVSLTSTRRRRFAE